MAPIERNDNPGLSRFLPPLVGSLVSLGLALFWKFLARGGPIISDEWGYLEPSRNIGTNSLPITRTGNFIYAIWIHWTTTATPLATQYLYVLAQGCLFFVSMLILNELVISVERKKKFLLFLLIGSSGVSLYMATLMPEIFCIFWALCGVYFLSKLKDSPVLSSSFLSVLICFGPFIKIHLAILSVALLIQWVYTIRENARTFKYKLIGLFTSISIICAGFITSYERKISFSSYTTLNSHFHLLAPKYQNYPVLLISGMALLAIFGGTVVFQRIHIYQNNNLQIFLFTLTILTLLLITYFSWSASSIESFEAGRVHGRYFLPLIFVYLPFAINGIHADQSCARMWLVGLTLGTSALVCLSAYFLNIYPWDDPFFFGLSTGKSPWGWNLGRISPILIFIGLFCLLLAFSALHKKKAFTHYTILIFFLISLLISSTIGTTEWILVNRDSSIGNSIRWALANQNAKCFPSEYPQFSVASNFNKNIPIC